MQIYVDTPASASGKESKYYDGKFHTRYFECYCDECGGKHPEVCVNEVFSEEGFEKDADLCWDCQEKFFKPELVIEDEIYWITKESIEKHKREAVKNASKS